jgi:hypothetical protein
MEKVRGYFTIERNIVGLSLREMEPRLGFRPGRLTHGARILVLLRPPAVGQFAIAGSTRYSDANGLVDIELRRNVPIPHAWLGQRLVKVDPTLAHSGFEWYPAATTPIEQWVLVVPVDAEQVCELKVHQKYWPRR